MVGLSKLHVYQQGWSPPTGGLCPGPSSCSVEAAVPGVGPDK